MSYIIHFADARYLQDDNVYVVQVYVIAGELKTTNALKCYMDSTRRDRRIPAFYSWPALQRSLARGVSPARRYKAYLAQCDETVCSELRPAFISIADYTERKTRVSLIYSLHCVRVIEVSSLNYQETTHIAMCHLY